LGLFKLKNHPAEVRSPGHQKVHSVAFCADQSGPWPLEGSVAQQEEVPEQEKKDEQEEPEETTTLREYSSTSP